MTRGRALGLIFIALLAAFFSSGQAWYKVSMTPNDETLTLQTFDGYTAYPWLSPLLLVCLAALAIAGLSKGKSQKIVFALGAVASFSLTVLAISVLTNRDLSGVAKQIETATGIAATHGMAGVTVQPQTAAYLSVFVYVALFGVFMLALLVQRAWQVNPRSFKTPSRTAPTDAISLWDEQR